MPVDQPSTLPSRRTLAFDHVVLIVRDVEVTLAWYQELLGLDGVRVEEWRAGVAPFPSLRTPPLRPPKSLARHC